MRYLFLDLGAIMNSKDLESRGRATSYNEKDICMEDNIDLDGDAPWWRSEMYKNPGDK
jgi:hypothetical protein